MASKETIRNYRDNFDFKSNTLDVLIPKYFPDQDISTRMSGLLGLTTEQLANISEDTFYSVSTLLKEFFITKATLPESIYSYAALFQISDVIGRAAKCRFLLVLDERELNKVFDEANMYATTQTQNIIYLSKNTMIYVEDKPFVFDYDIEITRKKTKISATEYVYSAKYLVTEYNNSISDIVNPYIKIRRTVDGFFALEVVAHQCIRTEIDENIIDNSSVNYPIIDVKFDGILAGFDAFYRAPGETEYTQLLLRVENSLPEKDPFCFYKIVDENILRLSFSLNNSYFQPEFNSELKIITYTTLGKEGNFGTYTGKAVTIIKDTEKYTYNESFIISAIVTSASEDGSNHMSIEDLRRLTATQFSTATVLSTDNDLERYFTDYEYRNDNMINFIKRRDDLVSRLYTGFMVNKNEDYVYPTNTLDMAMNYMYWKNPDGGNTYVQDPGYLFKYEMESGLNNRVVPFYKLGFNEDKRCFNFQNQLKFQNVLRDYFKWLSVKNPSINPDYDQHETKFEELYIESKLEDETLQYYVENELYLCHHCGYLTHETWIDEETGEVCCSCCRTPNSLELHQVEMSDFICTVFDTEEIESRITKDMFIYSNPFLMTVTKYPGLVNYYLTVINQNSLLDFINYNIEVPNQFIINQARVERILAKEKEYTVSLNLMSSMQWDAETLIPGISKDGYVGRRSQVKNNYLRVFMVVEDNGVESCYIEMVPTGYNKDDDVVTYQCMFRTNDHVTLGNKIQIDDYTDIELGYVPEIETLNTTMYTMDESEKLKIWVNEREYIPDDVDPDEGVMPISELNDGLERGESNNGTGSDNDSDGSNDNLRDPEQSEEVNPEDDIVEDTSGIRGNFVYITNKANKLIPMTSVEIRFVVLYKEYELEDETKRVTDNYPTNSRFFGLNGYQWTNIYSTFSDRIDFVKPLTMVRSPMYFRDDRLFNVAKGDVYLYSSPLVKYSLLQHKNSKGELTKNECGKTNYEMFTYMIDNYYKQYMNLEAVLATVICQATYIDLKFYNTYGRSKNYIIGDEDLIIDRVNISIAFHIYLVTGTDAVKAEDELKTYIKDTIENLNAYGNNELHISNLMRKIETNFAYVDHIKFIGLNGEITDEGLYELTDKMGYDTDYQSIKLVTKDINDLSKDERFSYVPEMLCVNKDQISLTFFEED